MKGRVILLTLAALFASATVCLAQSPHMGTWKLNEAKSKFSPGATKNQTVVYEDAGDSVKVTVDGVAGDGTAVHNGPASSTINSTPSLVIRLQTRALTGRSTTIRWR